MRKLTPFLVMGPLLVAATVACASSAIPTSAPDVITTIVAGTMAARTPTPIDPNGFPTVSSPTSAPADTAAPPTLQPVSPTLGLPGATRITFLTDATSGVVRAQIQAGETKNYVLQAAQAQVMIVNVDSTSHDVTLSLRTQGGTNMLNTAAHQSTWQGTLPQTEDYYLSIHGGPTTEEFTLTVTIPSRIRFAEGADSAKVSGTTAGGYDISYTVFAIKGQKMRVDLGNLSGDAALTIYGFTDGQPYVRYVSEQTSFSFTLPSTQDYIVQVVPRAGSTVKYVLAIKIE